MLNKRKGPAVRVDRKERVARVGLESSSVFFPFRLLSCLCLIYWFVRSHMRPWHLFLPLLLIHQLIEFMAWTGVVGSDFGFLFLTLFFLGGGFRSWVGSSYCQAGVLCPVTFINRDYILLAYATSISSVL